MVAVWLIEAVAFRFEKLARYCFKGLFAGNQFSFFFCIHYVHVSEEKVAVVVLFVSEIAAELEDLVEGSEVVAAVVVSVAVAVMVIVAGGVVVDDAAVVVVVVGSLHPNQPG